MGGVGGQFNRLGNADCSWCASTNSDVALVLIGVGVGGLVSGWSFEPLGILKLSAGYGLAVIREFESLPVPVRQNSRAKSIAVALVVIWQASLPLSPK